MEEVGRRAQTDKIAVHGYHRFYEFFLAPLRQTGFAMMEVGIQSGASLRMWKEYFPRAYIYGVDIDIEYTDERTRIFRADQSSREDLERVEQAIRPRQLYFINDDGSHIPEHQLLTFDTWFATLLLDGGWYVIEDIEVSYWKQGKMYERYTTKYGIQHPASVVEVFKHVVDWINHRFVSDVDRTQLRKRLAMLSDATLDAISSVWFGENCIIIRKKDAVEHAWTGRPYRWQANTI